MLMYKKPLSIKASWDEREETLQGAISCGNLRILRLRKQERYDRSEAERKVLDEALEMYRQLEERVNAALKDRLLERGSTKERVCE